MAAMSYLSVIESYHDYKTVVHNLISSILSGVAQQNLFVEDGAILKTLRDINARYPFAELFYTLDSQGVQTSENIAGSKNGVEMVLGGKHIDRSQRLYFKLAKDSDDIVVTPPYMSITTGHLCLSAALKWKDKNNATTGYLVIDINLSKIIEFLQGDEMRRRTTPYFYGVYSLMVAGLMSVAGIMLYMAFTDLISIFPIKHISGAPSYKLFEIIIFITLSLAIFDLGKTILEEEVLMHKDVFRHSSTRRTITRFIAAILIAVSIEALLTMFKASLGEVDLMYSAVFMMLSVVGLLLGLGGYVYLGAKAERILLQNKMDFGKSVSQK
jgi:hypothetical protein